MKRLATKIKKLSTTVCLLVCFSLFAQAALTPALAVSPSTATPQPSQAHPLTKYPGLAPSDYNDQGLPRCYSGSQPEPCAQVEKYIERIAIFIALGFLFILLIVPLSLTAAWKIFEKAGQEGSAIFRPIHGYTVLLQICRRPDSWIYFLFIPFVNIVVAVILNIDLAKAFGKSTAFGIFALTLFAPVGYSILAFGKAKYIYAEPMLTEQPVASQPYNTPSAQESSTQDPNDQPPDITGV
jgi:Family of unknown function (DUF5684)